MSNDQSSGVVSKGLNKKMASSSSSSDPSTTSSPHPPTWPSKKFYTPCYCEENAYLLSKQLSYSLSQEQQNTYDWKVWVVFVSNANKSVLLWQQRASQSPQAFYPVVWDYHCIVIVTAQSSNTSNGNTSNTGASSPLSPVASTSISTGVQFVEPETRSRRRKSIFGAFKRKPTSNSAARDSQQPQSHQQSHHEAWVYDIDSTLCNPISPPEQEPKPVPLQQYLQQTLTPAHTSLNALPQDYLPTFRLVPAQVFHDYFASDRSHMLVDLQGVKEYSSPPPKWPPIVGPKAASRGCRMNLMDKWVDMRDHNEDQEGFSFGRVIQTTQDLLQADWHNSDQEQQNAQSRSRTQSSPPTASTMQPSSSSPREEPPSMTRVTSWNVHSSSNLSSHQEEIRSMMTHGKPPIEPRKGGRVTSPLFPAYMHAVYQHRAARKRDSYLELRHQQQHAQQHVQQQQPIQEID
ncbi:unnamed protein product [Sympodiomycopsis kandeliae]